jgi:hypothetical protein
MLADDGIEAAAGSCLLSAEQLPVLILHEDGTLTLEQLPRWSARPGDLPAQKAGVLTASPQVGAVTAIAPRPVPAGTLCNGKTATCGGVTKTCPSSGGPTCEAGKTCECLCDTSDEAVYNACT